VTGANRGIGQALVEEAPRRGAKRVYAATRQPLVHPDERVTSLTMDVTNAEQIEAALEKVDSLDVPINNAGVQPVDDLNDRAALEHSLAVNFFGTYGVTQAFLPLLTRAGGAIVNVVSIAALAAVPAIPAYSISKAAAFNLSQSLRALPAGRGVDVHVALPGPVDTEMTQRPWPRTGAAVRPRRSSARTPRYFRQRPPRPEQRGGTMRNVRADRRTGPRLWRDDRAARHRRDRRLDGDPVGRRCRGAGGGR
jgi:NAD(P)-dependent dehydrogenase (short-subunit alcohol dehydrogenase family)